MPQITLDWLWTLNVKSIIYTLSTCPWGPNFWCVLLCSQPFTRHHTFSYSSLTTLLNGQKKKKKTKTKKHLAKNSNFTILLTTLLETLPKNIHEFGGASLVCSFIGNVVWKVTPVWSHASENEKKNGKNSKFEISNNFGRDTPGSMHDFWEWIWCVLSGEMSFANFTPLQSHVNENEITNHKCKILRIKKKISGGMVDR